MRQASTVSAVKPKKNPNRQPQTIMIVATVAAVLLLLLIQRAGSRIYGFPRQKLQADRSGPILLDLTLHHVVSSPTRLRVPKVLKDFLKVGRRVLAV